MTALPRLATFAPFRPHTSPTTRDVALDRTSVHRAGKRALCVTCESTSNVVSVLMAMLDRLATERTSRVPAQLRSGGHVSRLYCRIPTSRKCDLFP